MENTGRVVGAPWRGAPYIAMQFEIGPLGEDSIGNVGMRPETTGWVDHVVTPAGAFGLIVAEDALDPFLVRWIEERTTNRVGVQPCVLCLTPAEHCRTPQQDVRRGIGMSGG